MVGHRSSRIDNSTIPSIERTLKFWIGIVLALGVVQLCIGSISRGFTTPLGSTIPSTETEKHETNLKNGTSACSVTVSRLASLADHCSGR